MLKKWFDAPRITILFIVLVMTLVCANLNWGKNNWKTIIRADAKGYYAYLPAVFIYHDLNFGFFDHIEKEKYYDSLNFYDYRSGSNGKTIDKYYVGTAVCQAPFFLIAHAQASLSGQDTDGYSKPYMLWVSISGILYLLLGLLFTNKLLTLYNISPRNRAFSLLVIAFGTNLFYYVVGEPGLSHIYSFTAMSLFFYWGKLYFAHQKPLHLLGLSVLLALIFLIRPVNIIVVFALPFFAGSWLEFKTTFSSLIQNYRKLLLPVLIFSMVASLQGIIYKISSGSFFVYSYGEEGFNWLHPHFWDILFSYKKGLFLYTPVLFVSLWGLRVLWKRNRFEALYLAGFLVLLTYVLSSWWNWWYGGSFSSRVYVEFLPLFALLLAMALQNFAKRIFKISYISLLFVLVLVCQIQIFQYRYYKIHWEDMNQEKYWQVFLRVDQIKN